ncbi:MaoC family dehydratase [Chelativorans sp. SCAU2101]|jgi:Acyl dehydratase|uniref:MaoC family dehydratase n=1 Tax=Chelativorans petroleitrophicus TaxID=2975484 RepID=A0A9X3B677_9HYPH|nr:MaoC family dehydratase [Chelativorans petroleitrophicus]MCT8989902.1 MaoC family dehydratase [Chelativorans petroleitrophicus]
MLTVERAIDLKAHAGKVLGSSDWVTVEQEAIDTFARLTGDDHWIHVDRERARREMPGGRTIAHGLYLLSLIPFLQRSIYAVRRRGRGLNYGYDRVRFVSPVQEGSRVRLTLKLIDAAPHPRGTRVETETTIELEGSDRPALVASNILLIEDE